MNIIVAGRGTAGWMAALFTKKFFPDTNITVVYDDKTPIIGVGESTTPNFLDFIRTVDIPIEEVIKNCEATIKHSIKFTNWKGDGTHYHHAFTFEDCVENIFNALSSNTNLDDVVLSSMLAENKKVAFGKEETWFNPYHGTGTALHFNAKKMAEYLQIVGVNRGIKTVVGKIEDVSLDNDGYVTNIILDTKEVINTDFIFDCTGFARFFVNKIYDSPFNSYEKILPVKKAMPFFIDRTEETPPFTEAIAMKYGWMWKIPVGKRYGCGYVFDSDYIDEKEAYEEICEVIKQKPHVPKTISFKAGYNTKPLNKNTLALGLAHGFLEPLEATSLLITANMLLTCFNNRIIKNAISRNNDLEEAYNKIILKQVENCVDMVYIHYLTPRNDTIFWQKFKDNIPPSVTDKLNEIKNFDIKKQSSLWNAAPFNISNFLKCMGGVDYIEKDTIERNSKELSHSQLQKLIESFRDICMKSKTHDEYLDDILK